MISYSLDVLAALKEKGYSTYRIRKDKLIGEAQIQKLRSNELVSKETLNTLCKLLNCQPGEILKYIPDDSEE
jgi:putative transcriptional regulator